MKLGIILAKVIKNKFPQSKILIGGAHATLDYENIDSVFNSIFVGEAEVSIVTFLKDLSTKSTKRLYKQEAPIDIDNLYPDRSTISEDYIRTSSIFSKGITYDNNGSTSIMFSRGCPYSCTFCASPKIYSKKIRFRPIPSIIKEIQDIKNIYGIKQLRIQDDTFTLKSDYLKSLCSELKKLNIFYRCSTRVNHVTEENIQWLYDSGCREIGVGIECADDKVLGRLNKHITVGQAEKAIKIIQRQNIPFRCFFMVGLPFDSEETLQKNMFFIERNKIRNVTFANFIPFPGTDMHTNKEKYNIKEIKSNACMNIAKHIKFSPNIIRYDISEEEHMNLLTPFYAWMERKGFLQ